MDEDIQATITRIDSRISKLKRIKEMLLEEFSSMNKENSSNDTGEKTRKEQVADLLRQNGPMLRKQILTVLNNIPHGTIAYVLNDKKLFRRHDDGKWGLAEK